MIDVLPENAQALPTSYVESFIEEDMHKVDGRRRDKVAAAGGRQPSFLAVVEGLGTYAYTRPDGVHVVPIQTLCP